MTRRKTIKAADVQLKRAYQPRGRNDGRRVAKLRALAREGRITLVYSAHDELHNDAIVLREVLLGRSPPGSEGE
jgi:uncharacterized protein YeaO (DUF488 family)